MKRLLYLAVFVLGFSQALGAVQTPIYSVFTDNGIVGDDIFTWNGVTLNNAATTPVPPEGFNSMQTTIASAGSGWGIFYLQSDRTTPRAVDLSAFANGELRLFANCTTDNFMIQLEQLNHTKITYNFSGTFGASLNQWVSIPIPLNTLGAANLTSIFSPFEFTMNQPGTCYIDNIRYVNPPAPQAAIFNVTVKDINTQVSAGSLTWTPNMLPSGWAKANQYIELQLDDPADLLWGVQIYTNNTTGVANPRYSGPADSNPAGLVDSAMHSLAIPLAWSIKSGTQTPSAVAPVATDPNNPADPNSFQWIFLKDAATPTIPAQNTTAFVPGEIPVTMKNNVGIHFGQQNSDFGAENPPNYIFLEANFGAGLAQRTYQTNTLTIEYFTL